MRIEEEFPYREYNYCDYRCDTCEFSVECPINREALKAEEEGKDWSEVVGDSFKEARELVEAFMEREGFEMPSEEELREIEDEQREIDEKVSQTAAHGLANDYMLKVMDFLKRIPAMALFLSGLEEARTDLECYSTIIPVKLTRTLGSLFEFLAEEDDFHLLDAYLTSRVVYKALHKSLSAVDQMKRSWTGDPEELDELEALLLEIRKEFRREFPFEILLSLLFRVVNRFKTGSEYLKFNYIKSYHRFRAIRVMRRKCGPLRRTIRPTVGKSVSRRGRPRPDPNPGLYRRTSGTGRGTLGALKRELGRRHSFCFRNKADHREIRR